MKREYDFSKAESGKLYHEDATLRLPIYLEPDLQGCLETAATEAGKSLGEMVDLLLRRGLGLTDRPALDRATLLRRWRDLPPVDPESLRADIDAVIDSTL